MKTASILNNRSANLGEALKAHLANKLPNRKFTVVSKIADVPAGTEVASYGTPQFFTGTTGVVLHNVGTAYDAKDTPEQRKARFAVINSPTASPEEIIPQLGYVEELFVLPAKAWANAKTILSESRCNIAEADTEEEKNAAYKAGFEALRDILLVKVVAAAAPEPAENSAPDETPL